MSLPARKIQAEVFMAEQAVLEERIEHIQKDVAEMKQDIRRVDGKVDQVARDVANLRTDMTAAIGALDTKFAAAIGTLETKLTEAMGSMKTELTAAIGAADTRHAETLVSLIKWMIGTMIAGVAAASAIAFGVAKAMQ
jgi:septal ring factor EnvC (AmiA/AmiB activator)